MRRVTRFATLGSLVVVAYLLVSISSGFSKELSAETKELLLQLQRTLQEQQEKIAEQERRLGKSERLLGEREETLNSQQAILDLQSDQLERLSYQVDILSARWLDDYGTVTLTSNGGLRDAVYRRGFGGDGWSLAQVTPKPPKPLPPTEVPKAPPAEEAPSPEAVEEERPASERAVEELLVETGAVLLPRGTLQVEPSVEYSHTSTDRVAISGFTIFEAIVIGLIRVDEIDRDVISSALNVRYGVFDRFQLEARVPYIYREDTELLGVGTNQQSELTIDGNDIGDVEVAGSYQILTQDGYIPGTVLRLRGRFPTGQSAFDIDRQLVDVAGTQQERLAETPTGTGFFAVAPGATFIWRVDPVAFFTGGSYTFNLEQDQGEFGTVDPGDTIEYFAGMNIALSDRVALNVSFVNQITMETEVDGVEQLGTNINDARLSVGSSIGLTPNIALLATASAGLTDESPDFTFTVSVPINLSLF